MGFRVIRIIKVSRAKRGPIKPNRLVRLNVSSLNDIKINMAKRDYEAYAVLSQLSLLFSLD